MRLRLPFFGKKRVGALPPSALATPLGYLDQKESLARALLAGAVALLLSVTSAQAVERLGYALGITNDSIGQGRDRWQSSSVQWGTLWGELPGGQMPSGFGDVLEFRFRSDILTPERLDVIVPGDRRHAGVLAFGLHSYAAPGGWESRIGADIVVIGPQTGLYSLQQELHELLGFTIPDLDGFQIEDSVQLDLSGELARPMPVGDWTMRPFVEVQAGSEDLVRFGIDFELGGQSGLPSMRSTVSGQRLAFAASEPGWAVNFGADVAWVEDSVYLPADLGYRLTDLRKRLRGGLRYQRGRWDAFYGLTWLGEEFQAQREAQFVGTVQIKYDF